MVENVMAQSAFSLYSSSSSVLAEV